MCGLSGVISFSRLNPKDEKILERVHQCLRHRGPDASGMTKKFGELEVQLAHHRLTIQDTSLASSQPMFAPSGAVLIYNGEIYNAAELRQLLRENWKFETSGDTEVLLALLETKGMEGVSKIEGIFAFAYINANSSEVLLGRDRLGIKPLYWHKTKDQIWFASESSAIGRVLNNQIDPISFHEWAIFQFPISDRTFFEGVLTVPPASVISVKRGSIRTKRYWNFEDFLPSEIHGQSLDESDFSEILESAVKEQMVSDVPVGSYCSGGMDSSLVTALASPYGLSKAYVGDYGIAGYSEVDYARKVCEKSRIPLEVINISSSDYFEAIPRVISCLDFPIAGPGAIGQFIVTERASSEVKVLLSGSGGDELFLGYTRDRLPLIAAGLISFSRNVPQSSENWKTLSNDLGSLGGYSEMLRVFSQGQGFTNPLLGFMNVIDRRANSFNMFNLDPYIVDSVKSEALSRISPHGGDSVHEIQVALLRYEIQLFLSSLLHVEDRVSMRSGVEVRVPLLSTRILERILPLSLELRMQGGRPKNLLRSAAKNVVHPDVLQRKDKMGFPVPFDSWLSSETNKRLVTEALLRLENRGFHFYNHSNNNKLLTPKGVANRALWALLSLDAWLQNNS